MKQVGDKPNGTEYTPYWASKHEWATKYIIQVPRLDNKAKSRTVYYEATALYGLSVDSKKVKQKHYRAKSSLPSCIIIIYVAKLATALFFFHTHQSFYIIQLEKMFCKKTHTHTHMHETLTMEIKKKIS